MKNYFISILFLVTILFGNQTIAQNSDIRRPKLVVGIVVDQMRWDFLYRFYNKYSNDGFKRLLNTGFSCENTMLNYIPSVTAIGHTTIFTGSVPAIHGIAGNEWYDYNTEKTVYCTDDTTVITIGATGNAGKMSPRRLLATTITDELGLATNFSSKVVGISLKDRASILPAGHNPTAAFWIDDASGKFISSSYYMDSLPQWVNSFNSNQPIEKLLSKGWNTLLPLSEYTASTIDSVKWEGVLTGATSPVFPYDTKKAYQLNHTSLRQMPFGNTLTLQFAAAVVNGYKLGQEKSCDFLTINCASTDYAGHLLGPNAIEIEDVYLRLDRDLSDFFNMLDKKIGKGNYLLFLTADHGAAHAEGFMENEKMSTGFFGNNLRVNLESTLNNQFKSGNLIAEVENYQIFFDKKKIDSLQLNFNAIKSATVEFLLQQPGIQFAADQDNLPNVSIPLTIREMMVNGYNRLRSGSVVYIPLPGWLPSYSTKGTTHSAWNPYDTHIPLIFMGWQIPHGKTYRMIEMTDISATIASLLHIQMPNGCIGKPILEIFK